MSIQESIRTAVYDKIVAAAIPNTRVFNARVERMDPGKPSINIMVGEEQYEPMPSMTDGVRVFDVDIACAVTEVPSGTPDGDEDLAKQNALDTLAENVRKILLKPYDAGLAGLIYRLAYNGSVYFQDRESENIILARVVTFKAYVRESLPEDLE